MKALKCLDGTPISKIDRLAAEAFIAKGREAENNIKKEHLEAEQEKFRNNFRKTKEFVAQAKNYRKLQKKTRRNKTKTRK